MGVVVALLALWLSNVRVMVRKGQVLEGVVIDAEKIRVYHSRTKRDEIGVRYEFTTPDGNLIRHRVETPTMEASSTVAPAPDTRVYVWYEVDGKYDLL